MRAEIRLTTDVSFGFQRTLTAANSDGVVEAVRAFLDEVTCPADA